MLKILPLRNQSIIKQSIIKQSIMNQSPPNSENNKAYQPSFGINIKSTQTFSEKVIAKKAQEPVIELFKKLKSQYKDLNLDVLVGRNSVKVDLGKFCGYLSLRYPKQAPNFVDNLAKGMNDVLAESKCVMSLNSHIKTLNKIKGVKIVCISDTKLKSAAGMSPHVENLKAILTEITAVIDKIPKKKKYIIEVNINEGLAGRKDIDLFLLQQHKHNLVGLPIIANLRDLTQRTRSSIQMIECQKLQLDKPDISPNELTETLLKMNYFGTPEVPSDRLKFLN